jgi:hypothetical protein
MAKLAWKAALYVAGLILVAGLGLAIASWAGMFEEKIEPGQTEVAAGPPGPLENYVVDQVHAVEQAYYAEAVGTEGGESDSNLRPRDGRDQRHQSACR